MPSLVPAVIPNRVSPPPPAFSTRVSPSLDAAASHHLGVSTTMPSAIAGTTDLHSSIRPAGDPSFPDRPLCCFRRKARRFQAAPIPQAMPSATPTPSRVLLPLSCTGERRIPSLKSQTRRMNEATENARDGLEKRKKRNWFGL